MKKYKIREGSLLWILKRFWFVILGAIILVALAFPTTPEVRAAMEADAMTVTEESEPGKIYDVPLDAELQRHISELCDSYGVDMLLVLAIIGQESNYRPAAVGDNGNSLGLMQIQPRWHTARMERLGVTDLLDPYQNTAVGIDLLAELIEEGNGTEWAITAYNAGTATADYNRTIGVRSEYAEGVLRLMQEIKSI